MFKFNVCRSKYFDNSIFLICSLSADSLDISNTFSLFKLFN